MVDIGSIDRSNVSTEGIPRHRIDNLAVHFFMVKKKRKGKKRKEKMVKSD
jgi:hypothetical protein